jgi:protein-S-isoprenylcysteine O-methyltransferase
MSNLNGYSLAFIITLLVWVIPEIWLLFRDVKVQSTGGKSNGRFMYWFLISAFLASILVTNLHSLALPLNQDVALLLGTLIIWAGLFIRWWAILTLGKFFRIVVTVFPDHKLIQNGPYKYIRHPSYTGSLLVFIGIGCGLGNWIGLAVMLILPLITFLLRARVEENVLVSSFGKDYLAYMKQTSMFIPFIL